MKRSAAWLRLIESMKIRTRDRRTVRLKYNAPQQMVWQRAAPLIDRGEAIRLLILKARREGISTEIESWLMAFIATGDLVNALVTAHLSKATKRIWGMSKFMVQSSPLLNSMSVVGQHSIMFGKSVLDVATAGSPESERAGDLTAWHASEAAFYPHPEVMTATMQALPPRDVFSIGVIESTANGKVGDGALFYEEWTRAVAGESDWVPVFLSFLDFPEYTMPGLGIEELDPEEQQLREALGATDEQLAWRRWAIANLCRGDASTFHQEYPACLVAETRVSTNLGIIPIAECARASVTESGRLVAFKPQSIAPVFRAKTADGREIVGTADHPLEQTDGTFVDLSESAGRTIALRSPMFSSDHYRLRWSVLGGVEASLLVDELWARFLGYFMGDGCYHDGTVSIACDVKDQDVIEDARYLLTEIFGKPNERSVGSRKGGWELRVGSVEFAGVMKRLGIWHPEKPHRRVCVPEAIFRSPKWVVREFLRGLFEADGFNAYGCNRVALFSKWPQFLRDVQLLLLGFGITSRISERPAKTGTHAYTARQLELRSEESRLFNAVIGFIGQRKRARGIPKSRMGAPTKPISLEDRIVSVEPAGEAQVFDITVGGQHTFSANGIVVHNTAEEAFIMSGLPFFRTEHLLPLERHIRRGKKGTVDLEGHFSETPSGYLEVFVPPEPGHQYVIGSDSSMGLSDNEGGRQHSRSAAEVLDMETLEQVAEYDAASAPHIMARHLAGIGRYYNNALLAPEVQASGGGGGREILVYLQQLDYWYLHRSKQPDLVVRLAGHSYGWETNARTRPRMLARIREVVMERSAIIHSKRLLTQLASFGENDSGRMEALAGHDDLLFAFGIALMSRSENYFANMPTLNVAPTEEPDWGAYGLRVLKSEHPFDRLQRLLSLETSQAHSKSFLEY